MTQHLCPCGSNLSYQSCCQVFHTGQQHAPNALTLMRSRYSAFALQHLDYLKQTTVPAQQDLLDLAAIQSWSERATWLGLEILTFKEKIGQTHAQVEFIAHFSENGIAQQHQELSTFVCIENKWFFIDPTVPLPSMKTPCFCGSSKKFKHCCGAFFR